jgi:hypothetical protein
MERDMTGPEHYSMAQELIQAAQELHEAGPTAEMAETTLASAMSISLARAQVHATLALAAATVFSDPTPDQFARWVIIAG